MRLWEGGYETNGIQTHMGSTFWNKRIQFPPIPTKCRPLGNQK